MEFICYGNGIAGLRGGRGFSGGQTGKLLDSPATIRKYEAMVVLSDGGNVYRAGGFWVGLAGRVVSAAMAMLARFRSNSKDSPRP